MSAPLLALGAVLAAGGLGDGLASGFLADIDLETVLRFLSLRDANVRWVLAGSLLLGLSSGVLGTFALLRKEALLGDALAHAALPGVCLAFLITGTKSLPVLLAGALASGVCGTLCTTLITRASKIKQDAALAIVLSVSFGFGILLLTQIQRMPSGRQSGLDSFLFGQAAALAADDVELLLWLTAGQVVVVGALFKELKAVTFDRAYAQSLGLPTGSLDALATGMIVAAVVLGLQAVGVVLVAALLVTPAAAARQWTDRLEGMTILAGLFGAASGAIGAFLSFLAPRLPTGPLVVLVATAIFGASLLFAPRRGLVAQVLQRRAVRRRVRRENALKALYQLAETADGDRGETGRAPHDATLRGATAQELAAVRGTKPRRLVRVLEELRRAGLVRCLQGAEPRYALTERGEKEARRVVRGHRLWELYLVHIADIASDHVHRDADATEHLLSPEILRALRTRLSDPREDPHGRLIPDLDEELLEREGAK